MRFEDIDSLARDLLVNMVQGHPYSDCEGFRVERVAHHAVQLAYSFDEALRAERASRNKALQEGKVTQEEADAILNDKKIFAIKLIRERTGLGLVDAKSVADRAEQQLSQDGLR